MSQNSKFTTPWNHETRCSRAATSHERRRRGAIVTAESTSTSAAPSSAPHRRSARHPLRRARLPAAWYADPQHFLLERAAGAALARGWSPACSTTCRGAGAWTSMTVGRCARCCSFAIATGVLRGVPQRVPPSRCAAVRRGSDGCRAADPLSRTTRGCTGSTARWRGRAVSASRTTSTSTTCR